jgi:hypothetical protein
MPVAAVDRALGIVPARQKPDPDRKSVIVEAQRRSLFDPCA